MKYIFGQKCRKIYEFSIRLETIFEDSRPLPRELLEAFLGLPSSKSKKIDFLKNENFIIFTHPSRHHSFRKMWYIHRYDIEISKKIIPTGSSGFPLSNALKIFEFCSIIQKLWSAKSWVFFGSQFSNIFP